MSDNDADEILTLVARVVVAARKANGGRLEPDGGNPFLFAAFKCGARDIKEAEYLAEAAYRHCQLSEIVQREGATETVAPTSKLVDLSASEKQQIVLGLMEFGYVENDAESEKEVLSELRNGFKLPGDPKAQHGLDIPSFSFLFGSEINILGHGVFNGRKNGAGDSIATILGVTEINETDTLMSTIGALAMVNNESAKRHAKHLIEHCAAAAPLPVSKGTGSGRGR